MARSPVAQERRNRARPALTEIQRLHELHKFFNHQDVPTATDPTLDSQTDLICLRLQVSRALIGLFDTEGSERQYILSDSVASKYSSAGNPNDCPDLRQLGCSSIDARDSLCQSVMHLDVVDELSGCEFHNLDQGPFANMPAVKGPASIRYYYGLPLITSKGARIGVLAALKDGPRDPLSPSERRFMTNTSKIIVNHLELTRDRKDRRRAWKMNRCLTHFVEPALPAQPRRPSLNAHSHVSPKDTSRQRSQNVKSKTRLMEKEASHPMPRKSSDQEHSALHGSLSDSQVEDSAADSGNNAEADADTNVYQRATRLLMKGLDITVGGVVFIDTKSTKSISDRDHEHIDRVPTYSDIAHQGGTTNGTNPIDEKAARVHVGRSSQTENRRTCAARLAASIQSSPGTAHDAGLMERLNFKSLPTDDVLSLIRAYPNGKLFAAARNGTVWATRSSDSDLSPASPGADVNDFEIDSSVIFKHVPKARNIVFLPFVDPKTRRNLVCLAWSDSVERVFSHEIELLFSRAFISCLQTEVSRVASVDSDNQKGDFLSSISHELRSPLHGILAAVEFLEATDMSSFQQSLVDTVESCGKTLMDTLVMVLEHSKINHFERQHRQNLKIAGPFRPEDGDRSGPSVFSTFGRVNLAAITEEVTEGCQTGSLMVNPSSLDITDTSRATRGQGSDTGLNPIPMNVRANSMLVSDPSDGLDLVSVLLDIEPHDDWNYVTQPGAFRRIVMNLVGNSLKYTRRGWVKVELKVIPGTVDTVNAKDMPPRELIEIRIEDTGIGISPKFLETKIFTAFAQENGLSPGTGLGLSLVHSIVTMLDGSIDIKSIQGQGTVVKVTIPMRREQSANSTPSTASVSRGDAVEMLFKNRGKSTRKLYLFSPGPQDSSLDPYKRESLRTLLTTLNGYIEGWYGLSLTQISSAPTSTTPCIVIVDITSLPTFLSCINMSTLPHGSGDLGLRIIVLCDNAARQHFLQTHGNSGSVFFVSKPIGPYKLAKVLGPCMGDATTSEAREQLVSSGMSSERRNLMPIINLEGTKGNINSPQALHAMSSPISSTSDSITPVPPSKKSKEFPVPVTTPATEYPPAQLSTSIPPATAQQASSETDIASRQPFSSVPIEERPKISSILSENAISKGVSATLGTAASSAAKAHPESSQPNPFDDHTPQQPRLLLVDDNHLNLRLLQTFAIKRRYKYVTLATNGQEAVDAFESAIATGKEHQIIFMDISMPVLDGFAATEQIRALEAARNASLGPLDTPPSSLIIAVTGLASERDQAAIFEAGVDLYMSKPVSFKEIGKFLDRWIANAEKELESGPGAVPHGSVTATSAGTAAARHDGQELAQSVEQHLRMND